MQNFNLSDSNLKQESISTYLTNPITPETL